MPEQLVDFKDHAEAIWASVQRERLDDAASASLNPQIVAAAERRPALPVVLDLSHVNYIPSLGLGSLVNLQRIFRKDARRLILVGLQDDVRGTFAATRLDKLFEIQPTFDAALQRLRGEV